MMNPDIARHLTEERRHHADRKLLYVQAIGRFLWDLRV